MKRVLFIGVTDYNFQRPESVAHLENKFRGLSSGMEVFVLAKGKPFREKIWNSEFYLLPPGFYFWPIALFLAFWLCSAKKIDIIVAQSPLMEGLVATILKKTLRKELIVEIHGDWKEGPFLAKKRKLEFIQRKLIPFVAKFSLKNADKIRGVAMYLIDRAKKIAHDKSYFIFQTFTDLDLFLNEKNTRIEKFILFVGGLEKVKGVAYLIDAFSKIAKEFPEFKLVIIGEGAEKENHQFSIGDYQLENRVELKGKLSLEGTKNIMKNCYCLVLPSLSEGLPRVLLEAMALGKPVVASNVGGIPDLLKNGLNGFLIEPKNSEDLARKLSILLKDKKLAQSMGQKGREFVKNTFSNQKYMENYIQMINLPC